MKIDNTYTSYDGDKLSSRSTPQPAENTDRASDRAAGETNRTSETGKSTPDAIVNFSRESKEAQLIKETVEETPDIRLEKIERLKQEIVDNQYKVNPRAVADKMIAHFTHEFLLP
jgi:flagellar biosynthesis anti-sigma factor FlgM